MNGALIDELPSYELDFAAKGAGAPVGLEQFDHMGAYEALGPIYSVDFRGEKWVCIGGLEANAAAWRNPDMWNYQEALKPFREVMGEKHVTQMDGVPHREKRKQLKPGFAMSAIVRWLPAIDGVVKASLKASEGESRSLHRFFMTSLTFANAATVLQTDLDEEAASIFIRFEEEFINGTIMDDLAREAFYGRESFVADRAFVFDFLRQEIEARLEGKEVDDNFSHVIARTLKDGDGHDMQELVSEAYLLLMAGTGNTAKLLNCGLQHILADEEWKEALREEVAAYQPEAFMQGMKAFPKLKATISEIERLFPAAPVLSRVVAKPFEFMGYTLEEGTKVLHMQTITHFLEEVYEEPYRFKPQRWLESEYDKKAQGTFGGSTHICLGMNLARMHMPILLANILKDYELTLESDPNIELNFNYGVPQVADLEGVFGKRR
ncbi:MAG: cytochrome P450 [Verrucomicrobiota bacterium]